MHDDRAVFLRIGDFKFEIAAGQHAAVADKERSGYAEQRAYRCSHASADRIADNVNRDRQAGDAFDIRMLPTMDPLSSFRTVRPVVWGRWADRAE